MAEQETNPDSGVVELSLEDRIGNMMTGEGPEQGPPETEQSADANELSPDDLEAEAPAPENVEFEITHNGQVQRLSAEQTKDYAQKGFDYTQKTQQLAQERAALQEVAQKIQYQSQLQPQLLEAGADLKAIQRELSKYQGWDRLRDANEDPVGYTQRKAQYDFLAEQFGQAQYKVQSMMQESVKVHNQISQATVAQELQKAFDAEPSWREPQKFQKDAAAISGFLEGSGYSKAEIDSLTDSRALLIAHKAAKYDALVKAKGAKLAQVKGLPTARPGTVSTKAEQEARSHLALTKQIKASTDPREREALILRKIASKIR